MRESWIDYYRRRARKEREIAQGCKNLSARQVHLQLAALYEQRVLESSSQHDRVNGSAKQ